MNYHRPILAGPKHGHMIFAAGAGCRRIPKATHALGDRRIDDVRRMAEGDLPGCRLNARLRIEGDFIPRGSESQRLQKSVLRRHITPNLPAKRKIEHAASRVEIFRQDRDVLLVLLVQAEVGIGIAQAHHNNHIVLSHFVASQRCFIQSWRISLLTQREAGSVQSCCHVVVADSGKAGKQDGRLRRRGGSWPFGVARYRNQCNPYHYQCFKIRIDLHVGFPEV